MDSWINNDFRKDGRPKCLILVGRTGTGKEESKFNLLSPSQIGKTSFALSLFGVPNHFRGHWSPKNWNCNADYMIIDDVPWDDFEKGRDFPDRRDFLTGQDGLFVSIHVPSS